MKNKRMLQFAFAGLLAAVVLQAVGYRIDQAVPHIKLENQVLYNWLTLFLSPLAFFFRLDAPDGPIALSWKSFLVALFSNVILYAAVCKACQVSFGRLQQKLANEDALLSADSRSGRASQLAASEWNPRRI